LSTTSTLKVTSEETTTTLANMPSSDSGDSVPSGNQVSPTKSKLDVKKLTKKSKKDKKEKKVHKHKHKKSDKLKVKKEK